MNRFGSVVVVMLLTASPADPVQAESPPTTQRAGQSTASSTVAQMLGFGPDEKLLIIHADDAGMCHSVNAATIAAMTQGVVNSASVMVPCPWFPAMAAWCREHPDMDFGLHLALTSEWKYYRWRPVTPFNEVPGLLDAEGFLWPEVEDVARHATGMEVEKELRAQVERALAFGIKPTHLDTHMGTLFARLEFFRAYRKIAHEYRLPYLLPKKKPGRMEPADASTRETIEQISGEVAGSNEFTLDNLVMIDRDMSPADRRQFYIHTLEGLTPGITQIIIHCGIDDAELASITASHARRDLDRQIFMDPEIRRAISSNGIRLITWREIGRRQHP